MTVVGLFFTLREDPRFFVFLLRGIVLIRVAVIIFIFLPGMTIYFLCALTKLGLVKQWKVNVGYL